MKRRRRLQGGITAPFVSGTRKKMKPNDTRQSKAYAPQTPERPTARCMRGSVKATTMLQSHAVTEHAAMHFPRTRVGKISEQMMLGMGPNPMTKQHMYTTTLTVESAACATAPKSTMFTRTRTRSDAISSGIVPSRRLLQKPT